MAPHIWQQLHHALHHDPTGCHLPWKQKQSNQRLTSGSSSIMRCTVMPLSAFSKGGTTSVPSSCRGEREGSGEGRLMRRRGQRARALGLHIPSHARCGTPTCKTVTAHPRHSVTQQAQRDTAASTAGAEHRPRHTSSPPRLTSRQATFMLGPSLTLPSASTKMPCGRQHTQLRLSDGMEVGLEEQRQGGA